LPENAGFVSALLEAPLSDVTGRGIARVLQLDATQAILETAVRDLHNLVVSTLEGRRERLQVQGDALVINLDGVVTSFLDRLGISPPQGGGERSLGQVVLVEDSKELDAAASVVKAIDDAVPFLLVGSVVAFGGAVGLYRDKPRGVVVAGYAIVIAGVISLLIWRFATWGVGAYLEEAPVANMMIDSLASNLKVQSIALVVLGGAVVLLADARVRAWLAMAAGRANDQVQAFGVGRTLLLGAAAVTLIALVT
jgi:hypothetical protein